MKTIKEWLEELPEPYRTQALENTDITLSRLYATSVIDAINRGFVWYDSPQGTSYWFDVVDKLKLEGK